MREYSVPTLVDVPASANLTDTLFERARTHPDTKALFRKEDSAWRPVTVKEFRDEVAGVAKGLMAAGVEPGDRIALLSRTRYEWTIADYAIWAAGAVTVPIYETSSPDQIEWIAGDSGAKAIVVEGSSHEDAVKKLDLPEMRQIWQFEDGGLDRLTEEGASVTDEGLEKRRTSRIGDDLATIVYTSGTTGRPKGCELTHDNFLFAALNAVRGPLAEMFTVPERSTLLFLPLAHVYARIVQIGCVETQTALGHAPDVKRIVDDLQSFQPTFLLAVPRVFEKVYNGAEQKATSEGKGKIFHAAAEAAIAYSRAEGNPGLGPRLKHAVFDRLVYRKLRAATGGKLSNAVSGGSALGERLGHFFRGIGIEIAEGWGLTETSAPSTVNTPRKVRIGTVGRPLPGTAIKVDDDGELLVRGRHIFAGYWQNEKATAEVKDEDGWFRTGDIGEIDEDGSVRVTGRKKEIIITAGGKNVAPAPLEDLIRAHPLVSQCVVVGNDRPFITALITLDAEALEQRGLSHEDPSIRDQVQEAVDRANATVSKAESIRTFTVLEGDLTEENGYLTPSLKVKRNLILRDFAKDIDALYA